MIAIPALDLRDGHAVQLVGGVPETERVRLSDPLAVARRWTDAGFRALHVIDLDAALGTGENGDLIRAIIAASAVPVRVGGGIRDDTAAADAMTAGADRIIVGTRAVRDRAWLEGLSARFPGRITVAADTRHGRVLTDGWTRETTLDVTGFVRDLAALPLASVLITDVEREGRMTGAAVDRFAALSAASRHPIEAAGGIATLDDLHALAAAGIAGAVLGMALYTGAIDARAAAREFTA